MNCDTTSHEIELGLNPSHEFEHYAVLKDVVYGRHRAEKTWCMFTDDDDDDKWHSKLAEAYYCACSNICDESMEVLVCLAGRMCAGIVLDEAICLVVCVSPNTIF